MKNKILIIFLSLVTLGVSAQVTTDSVLRSKKGIPILPQKGDWAIGVDAIPYFRYLGNIFNNTANNSLTVGTQTIYGRYFIANDAAIRLVLGIKNDNIYDRRYVQDDAAVMLDPLSQAQVEDLRKTRISGYTVNVGYQKFRGYGRLKGFYGFNVGFGASRTKDIYSYGNEITVTNPTPTTTNYGSNVATFRTLENDGGIVCNINGGLLAGFEYYFAPKICVGAEVNLNLSHSWRTQANYKYEHLNGTVVEVLDKATTPNGRTETLLQSNEYNTNYAGNLYLIFHF